MKNLSHGEGYILSSFSWVFLDLSLFYTNFRISSLNFMRIFIEAFIEIVLD